MAKSGKVPESLLSSVPNAQKRIARFKAVKRIARKRVDTLEAAVKAGDNRGALKAAMHVQGDWQAITEINRRAPELRKAMNAQLTRVYRQADDGLRARLARKFNCHPKDVKIFDVSNPSNKIKVGKDRDINVKIFGKVVPSDLAEAEYAEELFQVLKRQDALPQGVTSPKHLAERLDQTVIWHMHNEGYGGATRSDFRRAIGGVKDTKNLGFDDPRGIGLTVAYKGAHHMNHAAEAMERSKNLLHAERQMAEGMYQVRKQAGNQLSARLEYARKLGKSPEVPPRMEAALEVIEKVENWDISPVEAEILLKRLGYEKPQRLAREVGELIEAIDVTLAPSAR